MNVVAANQGAYVPVPTKPTQFIVVRGKSEWSVTPNRSYRIYGVFESDLEGDELTQEMLKYACEQFNKTDRACARADLYTHKQCLGPDEVVESLDTVIEHSISNVWYGFITLSSITKMVDVY